MKFLAKSDRHSEFEREALPHMDLLYNYALRMTNNAQDADDLVQDCIEQALRQSHQLREPSRLAAWLCRILRNLFIDELRRRRTRGNEEEISEFAGDMSMSTTQPDLGAVRDLETALNSLSLEHREILILVSIEELNYREIANRLEIPMGTVMSRLARAREHLRAALRNGPAGVISLPNSRKKLRG